MKLRLVSLLLLSTLAASPTQAQRASGQPLREYVGKAYRIGIPANWQLKEDSTKLMASRGNVMLVFATADVATMRTGTAMQLPSEEMRRATTAMVMASDSLLLLLMDQWRLGLESEPGFHCSPHSREVRELGGQRAGFFRLRCGVAPGDSVRVEGWVTIKHGMFYSLTFVAEPRLYTANELTFSRIRETVVLAGPAPPATASTLPVAASSPPAAAIPPAAQPHALQEHVGHNVAYRLSIPTGWNVTRRGEQLEAANGSLKIFLVAANLRAAGAATALQLSASELQRLLGATAPPEPLLLKLADRFTRVVEERPGAQCTQVARERRVMAGQHAGFRSLECVLTGGASVRFEVRSLVKDGVLYTLAVVGELADYDANEPLLDRIRESLVLAPTPRERRRE